jgi:immune inhibitor A
VRHLRKGLAATAAVAAVGATWFALPAAATPSAAQLSGQDDAQASLDRRDFFMDSLSTQEQADRNKALNAVLSGEAQYENRGGILGAVVDGKFTKIATTTDSIFVILTQFGDKVDPRYGGDPGPRHNEIEQPDREVDNSTIWLPDFNREHYQKTYFETADDTYPSLANFTEEQSSGRYSVNGTVHNWVQLDYNEARYGSNLDEQETYWAWVTDSVNYWYDEQIAEGRSPEDIEAELRNNDHIDRYDYDKDGNYNEPDGYIDHFQLVHAGVGEETGGGAQGSDAIWSHKWYVNDNKKGFTGPTLPDGTEVLLGGTEIGKSGVWVGNYTAQPENGGQGVFTHEYMHDLGLPDEYVTSGAGEASSGFWTLMSRGSYYSTEPNGIIGDRAAGLNAWDKAQLGWITPEDGSLAVVHYGEEKTLTLGPAAVRSGELAQGAVVLLPDRNYTRQVGDVEQGDYQWWSNSGNDLDNLLATPELDASAASSLGVTARTSYDVEDGYDYLYAEASSDGGLTWTILDGTVNGEPLPRDAGDQPALTGTQDDWVDLTYDLDDFAGESSVIFRFRYHTDGGFAPVGFKFDEFALNADGAAIFSDDAETGDAGWTSDPDTGFMRVTDVFSKDYPQAYWVENRQLIGADAGVDNSPYNFGWGAEKPNWVEHFPYQTGPLVSYSWDAFTDNNIMDHADEGYPGVGQILPVDMQPGLMMWEDDGNPNTSDYNRTSHQVYDATLSLNPTTSITLHRPHFDCSETCVQDGVTETVYPSRPAVSRFDDVNGTYWTEEKPDNSALGPQTGTTIELFDMAAGLIDGTSDATIAFNQAAATTPPPTTEPPTETATPTPTGTLPGTGGGNSGTLAGIGLGAVVAGGLLSALAARRLREN